MKKIILNIVVFFIFSYSFIYAQEHAKFYLEIPNSSNIPTISSEKNRIMLNFKLANLNEVFREFEIYKFEKAFPIAKTQRLQNVYYIESNNISLKNILEKDYSYYFPYIELAHESKPLYTTNDYTYSGDFLNSKNLDLIDVKEAWNYSTGTPKFYIGISDTSILTTHEDLAGKTFTLYSSTFGDSHGTASAGTAGANTDNNLGISGIGFNNSILGNYSSVYSLLQLSQNGARVVNASWYDFCNDDGSFNPNDYSQLLINEIHNNGTVIVVSAGNGVETGNGPSSTPCANPDKYFFPASYNHVISVNSIGSQDVGYIYPVNGEQRNWRDRVEKIPGTGLRHQTNSMVDLAAPGYGSFATVVPSSINNNAKYAQFGGTSAAAPHVTGGISLMLTANSCLNPDEVESILKLTSVRLDSISTNIPYIGKMGAGRINIGKATKIAWQMNPTNGGEVLLNNRTFDRWHFELLNSPEYIRLKNEKFIGKSDLIFRAKKGITFDTNTLLEAGQGNSHYFYVINENTCFNFNYSYDPTNKSVEKNIQKQSEIKELKIGPNPARDFIYIQSKDNIIDVEILDISGKIFPVYYTENRINIQHIPKGNYLLRISLKSGTKTLKFVKD